MAKKQVKKVTTKAKKKNGAVVSEHGRVYVTATFNNTLITITNDKGETLGWSSAGARGFKGARKSTPYAASIAAEEAVKRIVEQGMRSVDVFVKGPGSGRDSSLRGIKSAGTVITSISDVTPMPHNGPRSKKKRRV